MPTSVHKPTQNTTFDIETGCPVLEDGRTPDDALLLRCYGPFDPAGVKITVKVEEAGPDAIVEFLRKKEEEYLPELRSKAALNPMLAVVTAVVYNRTNKPEIVAVDVAKGITEAHVLEDYWARWEAQKPDESMVGWNNFGFDDEMIIQRSIILGVKIPDGALHVNPSGSRRLRKSRDLAPELYGDPKVMKKLEEVSKSLGGPGKNGDGAYFSDLVRSGDPEKIAAGFNYLKNDEVMTRVVAGAMGVTAKPLLFKETGTELIVAPRTRNDVPMTICRQLPAIMPEGDLVDGTRPVLFSFVMTPKADSDLEVIFGGFNPASVDVPKKHRKNEATMAAYVKKAEIDHYASIRKAGAGDGLNSIIRAAGYLKDGRIEVVAGPEKGILEDFWSRYQSVRNSGGMAGWGNTTKEDDFVVMRSIANGVPMPAGAVKVSGGGYRSLTNVRDLAVMLSGDPKEVYPLQQVAAAFDVQAPKSKDTDLAALMREAPDAVTSRVRLAYHLNDRLAVMAEAANHLITPSLELAKNVEPALTLTEPRIHAPTPAPRIVADLEDDVPWDFPPRPSVTEDSLLRGKATLPPPATAGAPTKVTTGPMMG